MRKNGPFSSSKLSLGSVRNLKTKIKKSTQGSWTTVGKYSQKKKERWSSKAAPPSSDLPKLAKSFDKKAVPEDQQLGEDVDSNIDQNAVTNTEHDGADVEDRDGPPEDDEEAEPAATKEAQQGAPMSPAIFGFHDLPSTDAASPTSPRQANAAPSSSKNTPSQAITPCVDSPSAVDRSNSTNAVLGGEDTAPEEKSENSGVIFVEGTDSKCEVSVVVPLSEVLAALESELPLDAASTSEYSDVARLRTPKSMRSTVLVEGADNVSTTTGEDAASAAKDDGIDEDEGEDVYEEEGDYDGSIADESNAHFAPRRNKNKAAGRPKNDKERTTKAEKRRGTVNEKTLRHAHRQACKYLKKGDFALALEKFEDILSELTSSLGDSHRRVACTNAVLGGEDTAPEEKSENSGVIFVEGTDSKCEVSVVVPLSEVLAALESELPLDAASTSEYSDVARLRTPKSMRSTVLVEGADNVSTTTGEDAASAAKDDGIDEDEGEDVYEEEGDYDGSIADESNAHFAPRRNKNKAAGRPKNDKERTTKAEKRRGTVNEKTLRHAHRQACKYLKKGDFALALEKFEDILSELTSSLGDSHRRVASALHNVGVVNIRDNNLDDAIDALEEAIRIRKDVHGTDHPKVADSLLELGIALLSQKEHEEALEIFNDALDIREADLDQEARHGSNGDRIRCALQVARVLNNIGCVYFEYGSLSKALKTFQEDVLQLQKYAIDEISQNDPEYKQAKLALATTYCNIGYVHTDNSDYDDAIAFLDKAYAIQTKHLPEGSEISLSTLENLAYANYKEKNLDIALEMYQDILLDQIELYGRYDISCAQTLHNKACIQIRQCKYQEALDQLNAAEAIQLDILGAKSRRLRKTRVMISEVEDEMSKLPAVTEIFNRAMTRGGMTYPFTNTLLCQCDDGELSKLASFGNFQLLKPDSSSKMSGHKIQNTNRPS